MSPYGVMLTVFFFDLHNMLAFIIIEKIHLYNDSISKYIHKVKFKMFKAVQNYNLDEIHNRGTKDITAV